MNPSNPLQTQPKIGNDYYNAASAVSPNVKNLLCYTLTALPSNYLMLHRHWRINILRNQRANNHFLIVLHRFGTNIYVFVLGNWKSIAMKLIHPLLWWRFNIQRKFMIQMNFPLSLKAKMIIVFPSFRTIQDPHHLKRFFRVVPHCLVIHWASQMCNNPKLCFWPCSIHSSPWREKMRFLFMMIMNAKWVS